ncbi:MAG TPA: ABC transporter ATP-binding protein [Planctomycetota bacterium]|nr:ABC transporter ATP-binding protein [Planctomycetota bacterium]
MTLRAQFALGRGSLALDIDLRVQTGETVALVGPNGAGKTSCLQAIAGLLRVERGQIVLGEAVLDGGPDGPFVRPEQRGVGLVFQEHLLFPHLSAVDNVAFGLRATGVARRQARRIAAGWLARTGLASHHAARPAELSGGQAQRVALARAFAVSPRLLLLDEPMSAVDASARLDLRRELRAWLQAFAGVRLLVAHSAVDAFALADRIAVLEGGRIVQVGTVAEICSRPRSRYVADLVGLNYFRGTARSGVIEFADGGRLVVTPGTDGPVLATVHPRAVSLFRERPAGSPRNVWAAPVVGIEPALDCMRVQVGGALPLVAEVTPAAAGELRLAGGGEIWVALKATEIVVFPA